MNGNGTLHAVPGSTWSQIPGESSLRLELTPREREVMTLVATGLRNENVAAQLYVSPETVKSHMHNVMVKLGARTRAHAVAICLAAGEIKWEA